MHSPLQVSGHACAIGFHGQLRACQCCVGLHLLMLVGSFLNDRVRCICSGFFGFFAYPEQKYQRWGMSCSTFWGAWAFLLGSYIQLVEMLN